MLMKRKQVSTSTFEWKGRDMKTLIGTALEAGEDIDLFDDDYMRVVMNTKDYLVDLSTLEGEEEFEGHVMPVILDKAKSWGDGTLYTVPYQVYTTGVWYDKAMFEEAGVTDVPTTWDEFLDVCQKVKDAGYNPLTCNSDSVNLLYGFQLARYIGQDAVLDCFNNSNWANVPEAKKAAEDIATLVDNGYFSPNAPAQYPDGQNEIGFGESCMVLNASWIPNEILQNTGEELILVSSHGRQLKAVWMAQRHPWLEHRALVSTKKAICSRKHLILQP